MVNNFCRHFAKTVRINKNGNKTLMRKIWECLFYFRVKNKVTTIIQKPSFINVLLCQDSHFIHLKCRMFFLWETISEAYSKILVLGMLAFYSIKIKFWVFSVRKNTTVKQGVFYFIGIMDLLFYFLLYCFTLLCWLFKDQKQKLKLLELLMGTYFWWQ